MHPAWPGRRRDDASFLFAIFGFVEVSGELVGDLLRELVGDVQRLLSLAGFLSSRTGSLFLSPPTSRILLPANFLSAGLVLPALRLEHRGVDSVAGLLGQVAPAEHERRPRDARQRRLGRRAGAAPDLFGKLRVRIAPADHLVQDLLALAVVLPIKPRLLLLDKSIELLHLAAPAFLFAALAFLYRAAPAFFRFARGPAGLLRGLALAGFLLLVEFSVLGLDLPKPQAGLLGRHLPLELGGPVFRGRTSRQGRTTARARA
jgi:hypothetical protein